MRTASIGGLRKGYYRLQMNSSVYAFIFARGGSKGLPGKNIRIFNGKPLIAWAIETAKKLRRLEKIIVSTDCECIAKIAKEHGAEVPFMRPAKLAQDGSPEWLAWQHAVGFFCKDGKAPFGVFCSLPAISPLRRTEDVEKCIRLLRKDPETDFVITTKAAERNPYFAMVRKDSKGFVSPAIIPDKPIYNRQQAPPVQDIVPVAYVVRPEFILRANSIWEGRGKAVEVPRESAVDIDTLTDFEWAEFLSMRK